MSTKQLAGAISVKFETKDGGIWVDGIDFEGTWESEPRTYDDPGCDTITAETVWEARELHEAFVKEAKECELVFDMTESNLLDYVNAQIEEELNESYESHVHDLEDCH